MLMFICKYNSICKYNIIVYDILNKVCIYKKFNFIFVIIII